MNNTHPQSLTLEQFKQFISDWTTRLPKNKNSINSNHQIYNNLKIDNVPLSWFYRPILYSSLLPPPFPTINDIYHNKPQNITKIQLASSTFKRYIILNDKIKQKITNSKFKKNKLSNEKILFLTYTNHFNQENNIFRLQNIIEKIKKDNEYEPFVLLIDPISRLSLSKIYHKKNTLYSYYDEEIQQKAKHSALKLFNQWQEVKEEDKQIAFTIHKKLYCHSMKPQLDFLYSEEMLYLVSKWYYTFEKILNDENIKSIVLTSQNNIFEKCLIAAAQKSDIPIVVTQHGLGLGKLPTLDAPPQVTYLVFSEKYKTEIIKQGISRDKVKITGPLVFDGIEKFISTKEKNEKKILFATSPFIEDRFLTKEMYFSRVEHILNDLKEVSNTIILKLHPREKHIGEYIKILRRLEINQSISTALDRNEHYQLIKECDLVVSFGSTVALEAMIIGRPTLTIDMFDTQNPTNKIIIMSGATTVIKYNEDIKKPTLLLLTTNIHKQKSEQFVEEHCYKIDGKTSERIISIISKEIEFKNITKPAQ